ncbi:MAG: phosphatase PAP2 family protein [Candidatus Marinimicrobia bacterium]|nr:phosphatase PAP2 family protein [Candidatus Neomarinimicrobiota bacterium]MCF7850592.1 phosphatase PAP2 family protein [Candidatus Neomarinimicrobiota bacterium]MCF7903674.1 phosphatase PAP2 family protein [Candidatus Neomarinimicrobiota bacterium]
MIFNVTLLIDEVTSSFNAAAGIIRASLSLIVTLLFFWLIQFKIENKPVQIIRDFAPFLFTIVIYLNLHDTIRALNPHDIHQGLLIAEEWIFGLQPTVWIERFYHPRLTDWFAFSYLNYYWMTLTLAIWLYRRKYFREFRTLILAGMLSNYLGFIGYLVFPAASPYMVMPELFTVDIWEGGSFISELARAVVGLSPERVRDAFPSLHNGITLLTMIMAWRYNRLLFWLFLPMALSLPVATVYLRYHFVVDIIAGFGVSLLAIWLAPKLELSWQALQKNQSLEPEINSFLR